MTRQTKRAAVLGLLLLVVIALEWWSRAAPPGGDALNGDLTEVLDKAIDLLVDLAKLFITFAYGVIGALAWALKERPGTASIRSKYETVLLAATILSALSSIFFGHIILTTIIEMLSNDFLDLHASKVILSVRAQYLLLVIAVLCLIAFVVESFAGHAKRGQEKDPR